MFNMLKQKPMKQFIISAILILSSVTIYSQSYKVIVNQANSTTSVSQKDASDFFLKKKAKWSDGTAVVPVDLSSGNSTRESFSQKVHGKSSAAIRSFWQQAAFSGSGTAPVEKANDEEVIAFVKKNPGAIGYVSSTANTAGVKIISIN